MINQTAVEHGTRSSSVGERLPSVCTDLYALRIPERG